MSELLRDSFEWVESSESPQTELSILLRVPPSTTQQLSDGLKNEITTTRNVPAAYIEVEGVAPEFGCLVAKKLCDDGEVERHRVIISCNPIAKMLSMKLPPVTHAGVFAWACYKLFCGATSGFFTSPELWDISLCTSLRETVDMPYTMFAFAVTGMPSVVVECGQSKSWLRLLEDKALWLDGGAPYVNAVLLMKWSVTGNKVAGYLELHRRSGVSPRLQIFLAPPLGAPVQTLAFKRQDFYPVGQIPAGRHPNDIWLWDIDNLRRRTAWVMADDGLVPA
ncbi:hypothetical protein BDV39DRAFT_199769 [Aspergillus sergii]|uniref:Uncharacterized protein n=1 Tax=Aspergillus sergii TaxID=1034303 RepID=A0A5N6XHQ9_9EURO|nr:hypothetical protein BDV39DRAFT_199769 [Aspergillus sergii]